MSESPVKAGEVLAGKYRVERVLGAGNMGVVVAATHLGLGQLVALKFMLPSRTAHKEQTERFLREAKVAVRLRSQHSARVLDVGVLDTGAPYMVMELLEGRDLASLVESGAPIPVEDAVEYVLQVCEAMGEAHASGIVHRDLKPANLFLTTDTGGAPCVKVLDFGVSKLTGAEMALTGTVQALGSPLYMAPEQMQAARDVDGRSDIWSLGVVLFELLTGVTPFRAESLPELCTKIFFGEPLALASLRPDAPAALAGVILGCLEKDRARRFQNVAALAAALAPFAPPRARVYAQRVASIQSVDLAPSRPTDVLPPAPSHPALPSYPALASQPSRSSYASSPGGRTESLVSAPAIAETGAITASVALAPPPRPRRAGLVAAAIVVAIAVPVGAYFALRSRGEAASSAAPLPSLTAAAVVESAAPPAPRASAPIVDVAPPSTSSAPLTAPGDLPTAPALPSAARAPLPSAGPRRAPAGPGIKTTRPDYEGPRR